LHDPHEPRRGILIARRLIVWWAFNTVVLLVAVLLLGSVSASGFGAVALAGLVLGLLNLFVRPVLRLLGLPLQVITLGLSLFVIDVIIIAATAVVVGGLHLGGVVGTIETTVVVWAAGVVLHLVWRPV
jgi:putative membrane protein